MKNIILVSFKKLKTSLFFVVKTSVFNFMKLLKLFSLFFLLHFTILVNAQITDHHFNNLKFKHYTTTQGLSQGSVIDIHQDKTGYIWFGTREGLNKFDGTKFETFRQFIIAG